jgi:hypothetical protein
MSVLYERATNVGLGRHMDTLDSALIASYYKVSGMFQHYRASLTTLSSYSRLPFLVSSPC